MWPVCVFLAAFFQMILKCTISLKKCNKSIFSTYRVSLNDGFEISASLIRSVGEEVWAGLVPVASAAIDEAVSGNAH